MSKLDAKLLAFYLPQFHQIDENDEWWGDGFTEWTNVKNAKAKFPGHRQPLVPGELGYYKLNDVGVMKEQAKLAKAYGLSGFCFYHYWFNGKLLLEKPIENFRDSEIDFTYCLCWANENWSRNWNGGNREVLIEQTYSLEDDYLHFDYYLSFFKDDKYIKINGKPLLLIYRENLLPDSALTIQLWKQLAIKAGFPGLYICEVESFSSERLPPSKKGFDATVEFQPDWKNAGTCLLDESLGEHKVFDYNDFMQRQILKPKVDYLRYPCVMPSWDNTARRNNDSLLFKAVSPESYRIWLSFAIEKVQSLPEENRFVFINAWNEWAEGCMLEPDFYFGRAFLEQCLLALNSDVRKSDLFSYLTRLELLAKADKI